MSKEMVYQSNYLIDHRQRMTRDENRFFLTLVSQIEKDDERLTYRVPVSMFAETWNIDRSAMYRKVKDVLESLRKKGVHIETVTKEGKRRVFGCGFIADYEYIEGSALAEVSISSKFKPYLLELKKAYTGYKLQEVIKLDSAGAGYLTIRMYEICSQWLYKGEFQYNLDELKGILDIKDKYPRLYDMKKHVLTPARDLINEVTDITFDYSISGRGSSALVTFTVKRKQKDVAELPPTEKPEDVPEAPEEPESIPAEFAPVPESQLKFYNSMPSDWREDYKMLVCGCYETIEELKIEFTPDEIKVLMNFASIYGTRGEMDYYDYFLFQRDYIKTQWNRIRNKKAYIKKAFKDNYGEWEKF